MAVGGELATAFVLPGIYSDDKPTPSASADAWHVEFPDGDVMSDEPESYFSSKPVVGLQPAEKPFHRSRSPAAVATAISFPFLTVGRIPALRQNGCTPKTRSHKSKRSY